MKIAIDITYSPSGGSLTQIEKMVEKFNQIDELEIIQADKSLITFKIVELPKIKKTEGAFFARRSSRIDAAEQEKNIKNTII